MEQMVKNTQVNVEYIYHNIFLGTYNVRSTQTEGHLEKAEEELQKIKWDVIDLCEVQLKDELKIRLICGNVFYFKGRKSGRTRGI